MHFAEMIEAPGLAWEGEGGASSAIIDFKCAFGNIDIGCAIFAHRAEFDEMGCRTTCLHCPEDVERGGDVVLLCPDGVLGIHHGVGCGGHLSEMDDGIWLELSYEFIDEVGIS